MSLEAILDPFIRNYSASNPQAFWGEYALQSPDQKTLQWSKVKIPKTLTTDSNTYWSGRVIQIYGSEEKLNQVCSLLRELAHDHEEQFKEIFASPLIKKGSKTLTNYHLIQGAFKELVGSFHEYILQVYLKKRWLAIEPVLSARVFTRNFTNYFPADISRLIFAQLDPTTLLRAQQVCKAWLSAIRAASWHQHFKKIRGIHGCLLSGRGYNGTVFAGSDLGARVPGYVNGTSEHALAGHHELFWNSDGECTVGFPISRSNTREIFHCCYLDEKFALFFVKKEGEIWAEMWENYRVHAKAKLHWSVPINTLCKLPIRAITEVWVHGNIAMLICSHLHQPNIGHFLYRFDLQQMICEKVDIPPFADLLLLDTDLLHVRLISGDLWQIWLNSEGAIHTTCNLGPLHFKNLHDWNHHFFAFWTDDHRSVLKVFPTENESKLALDRAFTLPVNTIDGEAPFCSGPNKLPLIAYCNLNGAGKWELVLHLMDKIKKEEQYKKIVLDDPDPLFEIRFLNPELLMTCTSPKIEPFFKLRIWKYKEFLECVTYFTVPIVPNAKSIQSVQIKADLIALLLGNSLIFVHIGNESSVSFTSFPAKVHQISYSNNILIITPMKGKPIIASF